MISVSNILVTGDTLVNLVKCDCTTLQRRGEPVSIQGDLHRTCLRHILLQVLDVGEMKL